MAGSPTWSGWLSGLLSGLQAMFPPEVGSHEAILDEDRVGALLSKELRKPAAQQDAELLRVKYRRKQLANLQVGG
jgi:hypothetical protein